MSKQSAGEFRGNGEAWVAKSHGMDEVRRRTLRKAQISGAAALALTLQAHGPGYAQTHPIGPDTTAPEATYTIAPLKTSSIIIRSAPDAICDLTAAGESKPGARALRFYADDQGVARVFAKPSDPSTQSEAQLHVVVSCTAKGITTIHPLGLRSSSIPTASMPFPSVEAHKALRGQTVAALAEAEASAMSDKELKRRLYPPRPSRDSAPQAYRAWLRVVSTPSVFVAPHSVTNPGVHNGTTTNNWSGYVQIRSAGSIGSVAGFYTIPAVTIIPSAGQEITDSSWVGLNGYNGAPTLVQAGTRQNGVVLNLPHTGTLPVNFTAYYPWTEVFPQQSEQDMTNLLANAGDEMVVNVWVDNAPLAGGNPSAFTYTDSTISLQQHAFYRDPNNDIWQVYWDQGQGHSFEEWTGPGSPTNAPQAAGDPATMVANNQQHIFYRVFYRDKEGNIQNVWWDPASGEHLDSTPWAGASGTGPAAAGNPATMVANNQQHIFYRDNSSKIQHVFYDQNSGNRHLDQPWAGDRVAPQQVPEHLAIQ